MAMPSRTGWGSRRAIGQATVVPACWGQTAAMDYRTSTPTSPTASDDHARPARPPQRLHRRRCSAELLDAFDRADADDDVRVVIVTGAGRAFCAGADLGSRRRHASTPTRSRRGARVGAPSDPRDGGGLLTLRIFECTKPVIAAINGPAVGVGVTMTLPMDIRLAADTAKFGFVFAGRGIVPEARVELVPAAGRGHQPGARVVHDRPGCSRPTRRSPAAWCAACTRPTSCSPSPGRWRAEIADNAAPVSVALTRQMMWRMLGADHPMEAHKIDSRGIYDPAAAPTPRGRHRVPREAAGRVDDVGGRRPARLRPLVGRAVFE